MAFRDEVTTFLDLSTMMRMKNSLKLPRRAQVLVIALVLVITAIGAYSQQAGAIVDFSGVPKFQRKDGLIQAKITDNTAATTQAINYEIRVVNPGAGYQKSFVFAKSAGAPLADTEQVFKVVEKGASAAQLVYSGMVGGTTTVLTLSQTETDDKVTVTPPSSVDLDPITMGNQTDPGATLVVEAPGFHGQVISFTYSIITNSTAVDSIAPTITNVTPLDKAATKPGAFVFAADVVDLDSGFAEDSKELKPAAMADPGAGGFTINVASSAFGPQRLDLTPIENGWHLALHGSAGTVGATLDLDWFVVATDAAGNTETLQTRKLTVDGEQPKFVSATTGHWWDPQEPTTSRLRTGLNARRDNLRLTFTDGSGLDEATIGPSDFTVDTSTPVSILVIDVVNEAMTPPKRERPLDVFLTLSVELASDARPLVAVEGEILDRAGNPVDIGSSLLASDGLPPKFSVSLDNPLSKEAVAITIEADEFLQAVPVVRLDTQTGADGSLGNEDVKPTLASISTRSYSLVSKVDAGPGANTARKVNLRVTAADASGITGTAGKAKPESTEGHRWTA